MWSYTTQAIVIPLLGFAIAAGAFLLKLGINLARHPAHGAGHYVPHQLPVRCWICKMIDFKTKVLSSIGRNTGRIKATIARFGRPACWDLSLPMYQQTGIQTPHVLRHGQNPTLQLLALPYDIRRMIYRWLLEPIIALDCSPTWTFRPNNNFLSVTALLRVCCQTREEFLPIFYDSILFSIYPRAPFYRFYRHLQQPAIHGLREIHLSFDNAPTMIERCWRDLREATAVRELYITFKYMQVYLACVPYLDMLLLEARTPRVLPNLSLFQVVVACPPLLSLNNTQVSNSICTAARAHMRSARFWPGRTSSSLHFKGSQVCTRVMEVGYESSLDRRCRAAGVENPIWEF